MIEKKTVFIFAEYKFSMYTPSMIAAASVAAALHGLDWTGKSGYGLAGLLDELTRITAIEQVCLLVLLFRDTRENPRIATANDQI